MYRPQFPMMAAPPGFVWQPCVFQYDKTNTPGLTNFLLQTGQESPYIPLKLDKDAPFVLLAVRAGNTGLNFQLWDPFGNELMDDYETPAEYASATGPLTILEGPGIVCPAGSTLQIRLQGQ